jgi:hypothetical protein
MLLLVNMTFPLFGGETGERSSCVVESQKQSDETILRVCHIRTWVVSFGLETVIWIGRDPKSCSNDFNCNKRQSYTDFDWTIHV